MSLLRPGTLIDGVYRIEEKIGTGGMGVVYLARDEDLERPVALKFLHATLVDGEHRERFFREARALSALDHPNVGTIYRIGEVDGDQLYLCMAYYPGNNLATRIAEGPIPWLQTVDLGIQIARGLEGAHRLGIVHRDIKPGNILLGPSGEVKLVDFGLARKMGEEPLTRSGSSLGTVAYMSPEQARAGKLDARTDLWSLGVVLYEMIVGRRPFPQENLPNVLSAILGEAVTPPARHRPEIPPELDRLIVRLLEKDKEERPGSAAEVERILEGFREDALARDVAPTAHLESSGDRGPKSLRWLAVPAVAALILAGGAWWWASDPPAGMSERRPESTAPSIPERAGELLALAEDPERTLSQKRDLLESALETAPGAVEVRSRLADVLIDLWQAGRSSEAVDRAEELLPEPSEVEPGDRTTLGAVARVLTLRGRAEEAVELLRVPAAEHPGDLRLVLPLIGALHASGQGAEAERLVRSSLQRHPDSARLWTTLGIVLQAGGSWDDAADAFESALERARGPAEEHLALHSLAALHLVRGDYADALELYDRLPRPIDQPHVATNIANCHFFLGDLEASIPYYELAARLAEESSFYQGNLADALEATGEEARAREVWARAAELAAREARAAPGDPGPVLNRALFLAGAGDCPRAEEVLEKVPEPLENPTLLHRKAKSLALCGAVAEAIATARRAVAIGYPAERFREPEFDSLTAEPEWRRLVGAPAGD